MKAVHFTPLQNTIISSNSFHKECTTIEDFALILKLGNKNSTFFGYQQRNNG